MKKFSLILFIVLLFTSLVNASRLDEIIFKGNEAYKNENFEEAVNNYESVINEGYVDAGLFYNLGNAYFKLNKIGKAILYYEKTLKLNPNYENAKYNLDIAKARTVDEIKAVPKLFVTEWWEAILTVFTPFVWSIIVVIVFLSLLVIIALWVYSKYSTQKQMLSYLGIINFAFLIMVAVLMAFSIRKEASSNYGILLKSIATVKVSPNNNSNDAFVIHEGVKFLIQDKLDNWVEIKLDDGKIGWIPETVYESI